MREVIEGQITRGRVGQCTEFDFFCGGIGSNFEQRCDMV